MNMMKTQPEDIFMSEMICSRGEQICTVNRDDQRS